MGIFDFLNFNKKTIKDTQVVLKRTEDDLYDLGYDRLFEKAARIAVHNKWCSKYMLQKQLLIGYNRVGKIIEQLELVNFISPENDASRTYKVLVKSQVELDTLIFELNNLQDKCKHPLDSQLIFKGKKYFHHNMHQMNELELEKLSIHADSFLSDNSYDENSYIKYCLLCNNETILEIDHVTSELKSYFENDTSNYECYLYVMKDYNTGYYKIGISNNPEFREKTLQSEKPTIEMICNKRYVSRKIAHSFEQALHKMYDAKRIRGEWFDLTQKDVSELKLTLDN